MSDGPKISPEAAEGLRMVMKMRREGKLPDSPYPVVFPHIARPPKDDTMQYSRQDSPDEWPTSYTYEYEERLHRRRKVRKIAVICFILAGLGFTVLLIGG